MLSRRHFLSFDFNGGRSNGSDHWIRVHRIAMACRFEVVLESGDARQVGAARKALDEADRLEAILTVFRDSSEVVRVNATAAGQDVRVSPELFDLLHRSEALFRDTDRAFDVTATPLSRAWGFLRREGRVPDQATIDEARAKVGMAHIRLDAVTRSVQFDRPNVELNFGAIGKGYALDRMAAMMRRDGVRHALLHAGQSSVLAIGPSTRSARSGQGWPIDIRPRRAHAPVGRLLLRDGAVGTSGAGEQYFEIDGRRYGHVIDPRTGWPASGVLGASVITRDAATADALSTAILIDGAALAERYCADHPDTLVVVVPEEEPGRTQVFGSYTGATLELA